MPSNPAPDRLSSVQESVERKRSTVSTATAQVSSLPLASTAGKRRSPTPIKPSASRARLIVGDL